MRFLRKRLDIPTLDWYGYPMQSTTNTERMAPALGERTATAFCANPPGKRKHYNRRGKVSKAKK